MRIVSYYYLLFLTKIQTRSIMYSIRDGVGIIPEGSASIIEGALYIGMNLLQKITLTKWLSFYQLVAFRQLFLSIIELPLQNIKGFVYQWFTLDSVE